MSVSLILSEETGLIQPNYLPPGAYPAVSDASAAVAGTVGQVASSSVLYASAVSLTTATAANVTTLALPAGDWDIFGTAYIENSGANMSACVYGVSLTSATLPDKSLQNRLEDASMTSFGGGASLLRVNVSTTTNVYLVASATFASGTSTACGQLYARRCR